jgi:hypothetical protein
MVSTVELLRREHFNCLGRELALGTPNTLQRFMRATLVLAGHDPQEASRGAAVMFAAIPLYLREGR